LSSYKQQQQGMDRETIKQIAGFLFGEISQKEVMPLDARTIVMNKDVMQMLAGLRFLDKKFKCTSAQEFANIIEDLLISQEGIGRAQGVESIKQHYPKTTSLYREVEGEVSGEG
jgi:hypothetical protein